jgi:hypothetical protein
MNSNPDSSVPDVEAAAFESGILYLHFITVRKVDFEIARDAPVL